MFTYVGVSTYTVLYTCIICIYIYICMCLYIRIYLLIQWINVWHTNIKVLHQPHSYLHKPQHVPSNPTHLRGAQPLGPAKEHQTPHPPGEIRAEAPGKWNLKWLRWKKHLRNQKRISLNLGKKSAVLGHQQYLHLLSWSSFNFLHLWGPKNDGAVTWCPAQDIFLHSCCHRSSWP